MGTWTAVYPGQLDQAIQQWIMMKQILANTFDSRIQAEASLGSGIGRCIVLSTFGTVPNLIRIHGFRLFGLLHIRADSFILD